jgi:hypothetical protein
MKTILLFSFFSICFLQAQITNFSAIRIGMKDDMVERLVGLPTEIFRGFPDLAYHAVEIKGQLNYLCWRYKKSKKIVIDTVFEIENTREIIIGTAPDTTFLINDSTYDEFTSSLIQDTIYVWQNDTIYCGYSTLIDNIVYEWQSGRRQIISRAHFYKLIAYGTCGKFLTIPARRSINIKRRNITRIDTSYIPIRYTLILNQCVLFDPSSNRVVDVNYYPTKFEKQSVVQKRKKKS